MTDAFENKPEDFLNRGLKAAIGSIPIIGSIAAEFFNFAVVDPAQERRDEFLQTTFDRIEKLAAEFEQLQPDLLRNNEQFQATVVQAIRIAGSTASADKKRLLQNAILNSAIGSYDETMRHIFMQMLDQVTPAHIVLLKFLDNPTAYPAAVAAAQNIMAGSLSHVLDKTLPNLVASKELFGRVSAELQQLGLADTGVFNVMMSGSGLLSPRTSELGKSFLAFVAEPEK